MNYTLRKNGTGCYFGNHFVGAFGYADGITLLCPSRSGLQNMLSICESFGKEFNVTYNPKKTEGCIFSKIVSDAKKVVLCKQEIDWKLSMKYLGNILLYNLNDKNDVKFKRGNFVASVNSLLANFKVASSDVLNMLFLSYCCSFYGANVSTLDNKNLNALFTSYNIALRNVWKLPYNSHRNIIYDLSGQPSLHDILISRFIVRFNGMLTVDNDFVNYIVRNAVTDSSGPIGQNLRYLDSMNKLHWCKHASGINVVCKVGHKCHNNLLKHNLKELCDCRDGVLYIPGMTHDEIVEIISYLSTCDN